MKMTAISISVILIVLTMVISYRYFSKNNLDNKDQQASVIQAIQINSHLKKDDFLSKINNPEITLIDIRTGEEYSSGHIDKAINIDFYSPDFKDQIEKLDKNKPYLIYCRSGSRSGKALTVMKDLGFVNVADLIGGYLAI